WPAVNHHARTSPSQRRPVSWRPSSVTPHPHPADTTPPDARFDGIDRLYGQGSVARLAGVHLGVVAPGAVGSWAAEALPRSGAGRLTLIDADEVCLGNVNRQSHALDGNFGRAKVEVLAERLGAINPRLDVTPVVQFLTPSNLPEL